MEGSHGQLGAGLADGLGRQDADGLAHGHRGAVAQIPAVALGAHAPAGLAGEHRPDLDLLQSGFLDAPGSVLVDLFIGFHQHFAGVGIDDVVQGHPAQDPVAHPLDDFAAFHQGGDEDAVDGAAVVLGDDRVLGHVHQAAGQVTGVGGLQGRIRQTFPGAVGRDEVLQHRQAFPEVGGDRGLDDFARRLGHQTAHPGQLAHLVLAAPGPGVGHHEDRVEGGHLFLEHRLFAELLRGRLFLDDHFPGHLRHHLRRDFVGGLGPDVHHLVVFFTLGDQTFLVLLLHLGHLGLGAGQNLLLALRDHHVLDGDGDARLGGVLVAQVLQLVREDHRRLDAALAVGLGDELADLLLGHGGVDQVEGQPFGQDFAQDDPPHRGL